MSKSGGSASRDRTWRQSSSSFTSSLSAIPVLNERTKTAQCAESRDPDRKRIPIGNCTGSSSQTWENSAKRRSSVADVPTGTELFRKQRKSPSQPSFLEYKFN